MMRYCFLIFFTILLSCSNDALPEDVLPQEKMEAVLWDVLRADELMNQYAITDTTFKQVSKNAELYGQIFQIHNISKATFQKSLQYYQQHPAKLQPVIDSLKVFAERKVLAPVTVE